MVCSDKRQYSLCSFVFLWFKSQLSWVKGDLWQGTFYIFLWIPSCFEASFKVCKALFKCLCRLPMWFLWLRRIIKAFKLYFYSYKYVFSVVWRFHAHCCCNSCSSYYENHRTVKWARIFTSLPRPLTSTAPSTFFDEFRYRYHATPQWNMSRAGRVYERG